MGRAVAGMLMMTAVALGCSPSGSGGKERQPAGTPTDPVELCERLADVCRLDGSRLGVCIEVVGAAADRCAGQTPCLACVSQH
jgi:hypothetical protein